MISMAYILFTVMISLVGLGPFGALLGWVVVGHRYLVCWHEYGGMCLGH